MFPTELRNEGTDGLTPGHAFRGGRREDLCAGDRGRRGPERFSWPHDTVMRPEAGGKLAVWGPRMRTGVFRGREHRFLDEYLLQ